MTAVVSALVVPLFQADAQAIVDVLAQNVGHDPLLARAAQPRRGRKRGSVSVSVTLSNTTSTGSPARSLSAGHSTMSAVSRTPSASSICATAYGISALNAGNQSWWTTVQVETVP